MPSYRGLYVLWWGAWLCSRYLCLHGALLRGATWRQSAHNYCQGGKLQASCFESLLMGSFRLNTGNTPLPNCSHFSGWGSDSHICLLKSLGCWGVCILKYKRESLFFCVGAEERHLGPSQTSSCVSEARRNPHHPLFRRHQLLHSLYLGFFKSCLPLFARVGEDHFSLCTVAISCISGCSV